jgi:hypothetical protein
MLSYNSERSKIAAFFVFAAAYFGFAALALAA